MDLEKKQWEETFDAMEELVTIHGPDMTILRANRAAMSALGRDSGGMVGRKCYEVFHGKDEPVRYCPAMDALKTGEPGRSEHDVTIDGADYEVSVYPLKEDNKLQGYVHVAKDVTEKRRAEELKKAREQLEEMNRLKSEFLANMSHELRTPLNAVIGLSQVLLEQVYGGLTPKQAEYLAGINSSGGHLLSLINDILDLSKIEAGKEKLDMADFSAAGTLGSSFILVREKAMKHKIELVSEIGPEVGRFRGDERRVKQIIYNLLSNAIKFTEPGGKVGIRASQDASALIITVWDTGIGIPDDKKDQLFQPFQMIDSSLSKKREGTGLGLVLTKRLTEMHGGTISFESKEGKGTSFTVSLPMSAAPVPALECRGSGCCPGPLPAELVKGRKVMVVEDNPLNMMLAADYLKAGGINVIQAADGESALDMAAREVPDLILLDIQMPGIDGFEVLARLRQEKATAAIPVIAMTALAMKGDEERCGRAGFSGYVSKPVNLNEMMQKIAVALAEDIR
jgi:PAS domain S-box-containing protein